MRIRMNGRMGDGARGRLGEGARGRYGDWATGRSGEGAIRRLGENQFAQSVIRAFTLIELLTVIIIIGVLISILVPTISHIRREAQATAVTAQIASLKQAIDQYYADFHAYPGPISNMVLGTNPATTDPNYINLANNVPNPPNKFMAKITGPENLVLGLIGGLTYQSAAAGIYAKGINYDPALVGRGAFSLNPGLPKKFGTYIDTSDLSDTFKSTKNGMYSDDIVSKINDSPIPEILDRFPDRMPILYLRANVGATGDPTAAPAPGANGYTPTDLKNPVVIDENQVNPGLNSSATPVARYAQYDISQITAYTKSYGGLSIGEGKTPPAYVGWSSPPGGAKVPFHGLQTVGASAVLNASQAGGGVYQYPYPAYPYFRDPNSPDNNPYARAKDSYILISAGPDRIYGTADDITSFGDVRP